MGDVDQRIGINFECRRFDFGLSVICSDISTVVYGSTAAVHNFHIRREHSKIRVVSYTRRGSQ